MYLLCLSIVTLLGQYLLDDVLAGKVDAKMLVFLSAWALSADQREQVLQATRDRVAVWCYAPGYHSGDEVSLAAMQQLTGFRIKPVSPESAMAVPTEQGRSLGLSHSIGTDARIEPLCAAADATSDEVLATYPDGSVAVAVRKTERGTSFFVGVPGVSSELLRLAARDAGVHLYVETDCNVYHNGPYLVLHAPQEGPVEINTGVQRPVLDLLTGQHIGQGPQLRMLFRKGQTRVLKIR